MKNRDAFVHVTIPEIKTETEFVQNVYGNTLILSS